MNEFQIYTDKLLEWNEKINLTAITNPEEIQVKHFEDSLTCLKTGYIKDSDFVVDVGTGAGFPGLPLKIANKSLRLTLMDSLNKRLMFLADLTRELDLNVNIVHIRAEDAGKDMAYREKYDVAVSRAVANLRILCEYCLPLVKPGGYFLAMKGKDCQEEIDNAKDLIETLGGKIEEVQLHTLSDEEITHSIIIIKKAQRTPNKYPRSGKKVGQ